MRIGQRVDKDDPHLHPRAAMLSYDQLEQRIRDRELDVIAGTSWMWSRGQFGGSVDVLFVDEAGQLSLANVLSVAGAAGTLVLLGDPQQLAQPSEVAHPPGAGASALEHILGDHATVPADAGLLLDRTWRMHPELCRYTSDGLLRRQADGRGGAGAPVDPWPASDVRGWPAHRRGAARGQHQRLARGGAGGGRPGP